jgi:hypothetical protein
MTNLEILFLQLNKNNLIINLLFQVVVILIFNNIWKFFNNPSYKFKQQINKTLNGYIVLFLMLT